MNDPTTPKKVYKGVWARRMTHRAYATVPEMAAWLDMHRSPVSKLLKQSGLLHYRRMSKYNFPNGVRALHWYIIPPPTFRAFLFAKAHKLWQETMKEFPPSEQTISPYAAYKELLHRSSNKPEGRCLRWPSRRPTSRNAAWKKRTARPPRRRSRASAGTSS